MAIYQSPFPPRSMPPLRMPPSPRPPMPPVAPPVGVLPLPPAGMNAAATGGYGYHLGGNPHVPPRLVGAVSIPPSMRQHLPPRQLPQAGYFNNPIQPPPPRFSPPPVRPPAPGPRPKGSFAPFYLSTLGAMNGLGAMRY